MEEQLTEWVAVWRCDMEEYFCTETHVHKLPTQSLVEAAKIIEKDCTFNTLIELRRVM